MENILNILILVALTIQLLPVSLVFDLRKDIVQTVARISILIAGQVFLFYIGYLAGDRFLHLLENHKSIVILSGFFIVGIRMILDTFKIRKGERSFEIVTLNTAVLISIVAGINNFLIGLLFSYFTMETGSVLSVLFISSVAVSILGVLLKPGKPALILSSFLVFLSGIVMLTASLYLGFF